MKFAFQVFDLDGSGSIDKDELRKIVKATNMASKSSWTARWSGSKQCDTDGDGMISFDEFNLRKSSPTSCSRRTPSPAVSAG